MPTSEDLTQRLSDAARLLAAAHLDAVEVAVSDLAAGFPRHVEREELFGAGCAGLVEAAGRFDPTLGVPFLGYASRRIRGSIIDATRSRDWATRRLRRDLRAVAHVTEALAAELGRNPTDGELAGRLGMGVEELAALRLDAETSTLLALDQPIGPRDGATDLEVPTLVDTLSERDAAWLPESALEDAELHDTLYRAIAQLPDVLRHVLCEHHLHGRSLADIATDLGLTEARASQLRIEAVHALQAYFATRFDGVPPVPLDAPGKRRRAAYVEQMRALTRRTVPAPPRIGQRSDEPSASPRGGPNARATSCRPAWAGWSPTRPTDTLRPAHHNLPG